MTIRIFLFALALGCAEDPRQFFSDTAEPEEDSDTAPELLTDTAEPELDTCAEQLTDRVCLPCVDCTDCYAGRNVCKGTLAFFRPCETHFYFVPDQPDSGCYGYACCDAI